MKRQSTLWAIVLATTVALLAVSCGTSTAPALPTATQVPSPTPAPSLPPATQAPSPLPTPAPAEAIEIPEAGARLTLPLHVLAYVGQPDQAVTATLRWQDGTELSQTFHPLPAPDGRGLLIASLDWTTEGQPPQPPTQSAALALYDAAGETLAEQTVTVLGVDDPETQLIDLYWTLGESPEAEQRRVVRSDDLPATALRELLWGPPPRNLAGFGTAIPTPEEVLSYPGRGPDWGVRVTLRGLTIENGIATADFSKEMRAYGGGSMRVQAIRGQINLTLTQFSGIDQVRIAIEGQTEGVLEP